LLYNITDDTLGGAAVPILKKTGSYILKNILYILPFGVVCGVMFGIISDPYATGDTAMKFFSGDISGIEFTMMFRSLSAINVSAWYYILISFAAFIAVALALSLQFAFVEKHMRIGKRTLNGIWHKINDNFISTFGMAGIYLAVYELWAALTAVLLYGCIRLFSIIAALQYIFVCVVFIGMVFVLMYIVQMISLWTPCAQITGFTLFEALKYSAELAWKVRWQQVAAYSIFVSLSVAIIMGFSLLSYAVPSVYFLTMFVIIAVFSVDTAFFTVGQEVAYFEADQLERADLIKRY